MANKPRLQTAYEESIRSQLVERFGYKNPHQVPRLEKITLNMGVGQAIGDKKILDLAYDAMTQIAGQKPVMTVARKSIANFRLREGMPIGCMVTLRRQHMYEFLDRMVSIVLPRLNPDKFTRPQGMNITYVTSAKTDDEARALLELFGMPFKAAPGKSDAA